MTNNTSIKIVLPNLTNISSFALLGTTYERIFRRSKIRQSAHRGRKVKLVLFKFSDLLRFFLIQNLQILVIVFDSRKPHLSLNLNFDYTLFKVNFMVAPRQWFQKILKNPFEINNHSRI